MNIKAFITAAAITVATIAAHAHSFQLGAIKIGHPYARATAAGQPTGGAFMSLTNAGPDDRLLSVSSDVAASTELHQMSMDASNVMHMRQVSAVDVKSGQTVSLAPGGYHVMFVGLKAPLKAGDKFPIKLTFEKAGEVTVEVHVEAPGAAHDAHDMGSMKK